MTSNEIVELSHADSGAVNTESTRTCTKCQLELPPTEFYTKGGGRSGLSSRCKRCVLGDCTAYRETHKEQDAEVHRLWRENNREYVSAKAKSWYQKMKLVFETVVREIPEMKVCGVCKKEKSSDVFSRRKASKDGLAALCKECASERDRTRYEAYRLENIARVKEYNSRPENKARQAIRRREYQKNRLKTDVEFRLARNLRKRLWEYLRGSGKEVSAIKDLGCTISFLKSWLESKFAEGMTWDNYGIYWHVDHVKPLSWFKLEDLEQQKAAVHYTNLQPMTGPENMSKGNRWEG
jgi:hypothetical protein